MLAKAGLRVALVDAKGIAGGGSGAAGAFIAPKFVKSGPVKELSEAAFHFSLAWYEQHFGAWTSSSRLLHIANNALSNARVAYFKTHTSLPFSAPDPQLLTQLQPQAQAFESLLLASSAVVDVKGACSVMAAEAQMFKIHVKSLRHERGLWHLGALQARHVVLSTGAHEHLLDIPYFTPRAVFGHRINIHTTTHNPLNMHQFVSISKSDSKGIIAIGATHDVHYNPLRSEVSYDYAKGRMELLEKASRTIALEDVEVMEDFTGVRAASIDHLPLLGPVVDFLKTVETLPKISQGKEYNINQYKYYPNLYMMNGVGGYGFVLAPYLAVMLRNYLVHGSAIDPLVLPSRFVRRYMMQKCR